MSNNGDNTKTEKEIMLHNYWTQFKLFRDELLQFEQENVYHSRIIWSIVVLLRQSKSFLVLIPLSNNNVNYIPLSSFSLKRKSIFRRLYLFPNNRPPTLILQPIYQQTIVSKTCLCYWTGHNWQFSHKHVTDPFHINTKHEKSSNKIHHLAS